MAPSSRALAVLVLAFLATMPAAAQVVVDTFDVDQPLLQLTSVPSTVNDHNADDPSILGGERNLRISGSDLSGGNITVQVSGGVLTFNRPGTSAGEVDVWWDGDNDTATFDPLGLGGMNLTSGGRDRFRLQVISSSSATLHLRMVVWTTGTDFSELNFTLPAGGGFVDLPFASFVAGGGAGATFTNVGALYLRMVENTGAWTASLGSLAITTSLPTVELISTTFATGEGAVFASIGVNRSGPTAGTVTVQYSTSDNTAVAPGDYAASTGTVTFDPGETADSFNIPIVQDSVDEPNELFNITLSNPVGATLGVPSAGTLQILDDDGPPSITIGNLSLNEGNGGVTPFTFTATLSSPSGFPISFDYATADGSATAPGDYASVATTTVNIPAGAPTGSFTVNVNGDATIEPDETFVVNLSNATNATLATTQATATIVNDDALGSANLSLTKISSAPTFTSGDSVTFTLAVANAGPDPATNVVVTDALPAGATYVSATPSAGSCLAGPPVTCTIPTLANGASATIALVATLAGTNPITNSATVSATETDSNSANNTGSATVNAAAAAEPIPAASSWMLALLAAAIGFAAVRFLR
jgi:uncharacterized repeat protein (TIGR01451 family)